MKTVTIGIGQGITLNDGESASLSFADWEAFRNATIGAIRRLGTLHSQATGSGYWDGVEEACATLVASVSADRLSELVKALAELAQEYQQEAIALTIGETHFIGAQGEWGE